MHLSTDLSPYRFTGSAPFRPEGFPTSTEPLYADKEAYKNLLDEYRDEIDDLQNRMYAHDRYSMLLIFQAMDAAGKDGTIREVMSGVNPHGVSVHAFKRPSETELEHDFLWRSTLCLPARGTIGIFNRSYYEEVLVVRVHPRILTEGQRIPAELTADPERVWWQRFEDIRHHEAYLHRNGTHILKFFLHISRDEQKRRFLERIRNPKKNWKFSAGDLDERAHWDAYMNAYEDVVNATATPQSPWFVIPADDKLNARLLVAQAVLDALRSLDLSYPVPDAERLAELEECERRLLSEPG
jgi:PPK2 family polyphosphate:nucleotide phosphotransferase